MFGEKFNNTALWNNNSSNISDIYNKMLGLDQFLIGRGGWEFGSGRNKDIDYL